MSVLQYIQFPVTKVSIVFLSIFFKAQRMFLAMTPTTLLLALSQRRTERQIDSVKKEEAQNISRDRKGKMYNKRGS